MPSECASYRPPPRSVMLSPSSLSQAAPGLCSAASKCCKAVQCHALVISHLVRAYSAARGAKTLKKSRGVRPFLFGEEVMKNTNVRRRPIAGAVSLALGSGVAAALIAFPTLAQQSVERVEITGSNIKRELEGQALPVQVYTREEIDRIGAQTIEQLIYSLPAVQSAGSYSGAASAGISTYGISTVSLRGLGSQRTLVLLNGRRLAPFGVDTASVDINAIPMAAVERVEVLTDGASSVYGSDAVAGVMNFILRKDFQGAEIGLEIGEPSRSGGGETRAMNAIMGFGKLKDDSYNFTLFLGKSKQERLMAADRKFSSTGNQPPWLVSSATPSGRIEGIWVEGNTAAQNSASPANPLGISSRGYGNRGRDLPGGCKAMNMFPIPNASRTPSTGLNCNFDSNPYVSLFPEQVAENIGGSFRLQLNPTLQFFGEGMRNRKTNIEAIQPSPVRVAFLATDNAFAGSGVDPALLIRPANPNYPTQWLNTHGLGAMVGNTLAVTARTFLTGPRTVSDTTTQTRILGGFSGTIKDWDWEAAYYRETSKVRGSAIDGYFSQLGLASVLNATAGPTANLWDPWAPGGVQPAVVQAALAGIKYIGPTAIADLDTTSFDVKFSGNITKLPAGPLAAAFGLVRRHENYDVQVPPILGTGDIAGLGGATLPASGDRTIYGLFGELNIPIIKNLEGNLSARYDRYSDLEQKTSTTGKASLRWTPTPSVLFRGSLGTGFRAPSLNDLHQPKSLGTTEVFFDPGLGTTTQSNALIGGNSALKPEKSKQYSVGLVFSPARSQSFGQFTGSVDYWHVKIEDMILAPSAQALVNAALAGSPLFGPGDVTFSPDGSVDTVDQRFRNSGIATYEGWDLGGHWDRSFGFGRLFADYRGSVMTQAQLKTLCCTENALGTMVDSAGNPLTMNINGGVTLRYKYMLTVGWSLEGWGASLTQNYWSGYRDGNDQPTGTL